MKKHLKEIVNELEQFSKDHKFLNDFGFGDISNISTNQHQYPMMWVNPVSSNLGRQFDLNFDIYIIDLLKQDRSNLLDIMNQTLLIGNDIVAEYFNDEDQNDFLLNEEGVDVTPFEAEFDDFTAGFIFNIQIQISNGLSKCEIPLNDE